MAVTRSQSRNQEDQDQEVSSFTSFKLSCYKVLMILKTEDTKKQRRRWEMERRGDGTWGFIKVLMEFKYK